MGDSIVIAVEVDSVSNLCCHWFGIRDWRFYQFEVASWLTLIAKLCLHCVPVLGHNGALFIHLSYDTINTRIPHSHAGPNSITFWRLVSWNFHFICSTLSFSSATRAVSIITEILGMIVKRLLCTRSLIA